MLSTKQGKAVYVFVDLDVRKRRGFGGEYERKKGYNIRRKKTLGSTWANHCTIE